MTPSGCPPDVEQKAALLDHRLKQLKKDPRYAGNELASSWNKAVDAAREIASQTLGALIAAVRADASIRITEAYDKGLNDGIALKGASMKSAPVTPEPSQLAERLKQVVPGNTLVRCPRCRSFGEASGAIKFTCNKCSYYPITVAAHEVSYTKKGQSSDQQPMVLATGASSTRISEEQATAAPVTPEPSLDCPCGYRPESPSTHPHVLGCPNDKPASEARPTTEDTPKAHRWEVVPGTEDDDWGIRREGETTGMSVAQMLWRKDAELVVGLHNANLAPSAPEGRTLRDVVDEARSWSKTPCPFCRHPWPSGATMEPRPVHKPNCPDTFTDTLLAVSHE